MKERKRRGVILISECYFSERVRRWSSELAVAVVVQHFLEICASARNAIKISIAFAKREVSVCTTCATRIIVEILLIFRSRQIVKFAIKQTVRVIELTLIGRLAFARRRLRRFVL